MTTANLDQVKKTIGDLLRLSEDAAATDGEIANAIKFARRLMDAHHLSEEECRKDPMSAAAREERFGKSYVHSQSNKLAAWESSLASFVVEFVGSIGCYIQVGTREINANGIVVRDEQGRARDCARITFYGTEEDILLATELYETLRMTVATMARLKWGGAFRGPGRSYAEGFVSGMFGKLRDTKRADEQADSQSRALVVRATALASATQQRAKTWLREVAKVKLGGSYRTGGGSWHANANSEGRQDGARANVSSSRRAKLGSQQKQIGG